MRCAPHIEWRVRDECSEGLKSRAAHFPPLSSCDQGIIVQAAAALACPLLDRKLAKGPGATGEDKGRDWSLSALACQELSAAQSKAHRDPSRPSSCLDHILDVSSSTSSHSLPEHRVTLVGAYKTRK